jgi:hypothetical protein
MSLRAVYERFLASPNPLSLSEDATLKYITTLTTFTKAGPIVKHLEAQTRNVVKKKGEHVIGVVEGHSSLSMDIETTLEFMSGGGAYLPGLENFVTDKIVTFPTVRRASSPREKISLMEISSNTFADPHCALRPGKQNPTHPNLLGSRCTAETSRCHRFSSKELAYL